MAAEGGRPTSGAGAACHPIPHLLHRLPAGACVFCHLFDAQSCIALLEILISHAYFYAKSLPLNVQGLVWACETALTWQRVQMWNGGKLQSMYHAG